jgi:hypothetical protein
MKLRVPEIVLGAFLTVAVFAMGMVVESSRHPPSDEHTAANTNHRSTPEATEKSPDKITDWLLVVFNGLLFCSTIFLWSANNRSAKIAERALTDIERPYIYIFNPSGLKIDLDQEDPFHYFKYSIANYGKTPARIEGAFVGVSAGVAPRFPRTVVGWDDFLISPLFVSGERRDSPTALIPDEIEIIETADEYGQYETPVLTGDGALFLWIIVRYSGPFSKGHETSACWRWTETSRRLVLHEKHNHQT